MKLLKRIICTLFHREDLWPMHGQVTCRICHLSRPAYKEVSYGSSKAA